MRTFRSKSGPFTEQPFYEPAEIEKICAEELRKCNLYPLNPAPIRIDRFIEKHFGIQPTYADLPEGLLGYTEFGTGGVERIVVTKFLDEEGTVVAERRLRTTLAHEGGHGLLHSHLFALVPRPDFLFGNVLGSDSPKILCRNGGISGVGPPAKKSPYCWWEFQANQAMSAVLLPKDLVGMALADLLIPHGLLGVPKLDSDDRERAIHLLAETFDVNPVVARIRLERLHPRATAGQLAL